MCVASQSYPFNSLRILWRHCVTKPFQFRIFSSIPSLLRHFHERQFRPSTHTTHTPLYRHQHLQPTPRMNGNQFWFLTLLSFILFFSPCLCFTFRNFNCYQAIQMQRLPWYLKRMGQDVWLNECMRWKKRKKIVKWTKLGKIDASAKEEKWKSKKV